MTSNVKLSDLSILENYSKIHEDFLVVGYKKKNMGELLKWKFPNNWGASVIANNYTQWRPQLFIIKFSCNADEVGSLNYDSGIIDSHVGYINQITVSELAVILAKVQGLRNETKNL